MNSAMSMTAESGPERTCVGCGRRRGQAELLRFSNGPGGLRVHLQKGEGRGAYCCPDAGCLERTVNRKALQRALGLSREPVRVEEIREAVHQAILTKVRGILGLARRARRVVGGSRAVAQALEAGRIRLVLFDRDTIPRGGKQLRESAEQRGVPVVRLFSRVDLGAALGGPSREVVGVLDGGFAEGILRILRFWIPASSTEQPLQGTQGRGTGGEWRG